MVNLAGRNNALGKIEDMRSGALRDQDERVTLART